MKITNEIKAKVFAQYFGHQVQVRRKYDSDKDFLVGRICEVTLKSNHGDWVQVWFDDVYTVTNNNHNESSSNSHYFFFGEDHTKLILRPLSEITDEDAIEVAKLGQIAGIAYDKFAVHGRLLLSHYIQRQTNVSGISWFAILQYLQSKGYDLPNYLLGGKTLKEAGLAIYEAKQPA